MSGKTSIEHILLSHYRAITDINWHTTECDVVVSTGIDSWLWAWDLREPRKPIFGLSAFKAGGTQVKWNRKDGNILASSHLNEVLIWDRRKGSLPVTQIRAHSSKIYGIDWSRSNRNEIVTCSLDKSIKTWDINASDLQENPNPKPKATIQTNYPVWRARNLPFGEGILSLPQRGETTLEMYAKGEPQERIETFEGHSDVVKEFVWREGAQGLFYLFFPLNVEIECHFIRYLPTNNLVKGPHPAVLAY
jgi:WD40 repeat protein